MSCPTTPHGEDIGDDATGRRYLNCADCGGEYCVDPGGPYDQREADDLIGEFITIPTWAVTGMVIARRPATRGTEDAIEVLVETEPDDPRPRWYRLEPLEFRREGA